MDFIDELKAKFPEMYENAYDVWVDEGWQPIIFKLSEAIQHHIKSHNQHNEYIRTRGGNGLAIDVVNIPQVTVQQIKEKFGGLRFYYDGGDDHIQGLVDMAEVWASSTCEMCGKPGQSRHGGWIKTLCDEHDAERKAKYGQMEVSPMVPTPDPNAD